ncbi:expressed protein, partial [Chlorella variabilis]
MSAFFHVAWIVILLTWAGVTGAWPGRCSSSGGVQYLVLGGGLLGSFAVNLAVDVLLVYHSLQGAPFEASKRRWVVPLLYTATGPLVCTLGFTVTNLAQALVFSTWGFLAIAVIGIAVTYNMYPQHHDLSSWEARCKCLAAMLCCKANITRRPDGKRAPLTNIAELTAGLLSHCDLDATDITVGLFLAAAAQKRRRRLRVAKALLPVYRALRSTAGSSAADERSQTEDEDHGSEEDAGSTASSINDVPADRELDHMIAAQQRLSHERQQEDSTVLDRASTLQGPGDAGGRQPVRIPQRQAKAGAIRSAAELVAGDLLADLPAGLPDQHAEILDRLAGAIEEEIVQAEGGGQQASSEAVLVKEESLDLSALQVDPDAPSIWFSTASSRQVGTLDGMSSRGSRLSGQGKAGGTQRRHTKVPSSVLKEAIYCLKYSYAVYSLQPKIEAPSSGLDVASCACCGRPTDPQQAGLGGDVLVQGWHTEDCGRLSQHCALTRNTSCRCSSVEILMVNCSNRVLAHLPYMVVADHGRRAVVLAIRGTISIADLVTDAVVYPEPLDSFLPQEIKEELSEPAFAHAGMVAAAKAIFEDMLQRDILPQLVRDEAMADFTAPEQQEARRDGLAHPQRASQYDADAGSCAPGAEQYMITGHSVSGGDGGSNGPVRRERAGPSGDALEQSQQQDQQPGVQGRQRLQGAGSEQSPGRQVGEIMRHLIEDEGWQFIVEGHSLGAGAAALISLKLLETYPGLKCLAYSCPGLVSKNLAHAMSRFCTTVVCGKDAV